MTLKDFKKPQLRKMLKAIQKTKQQYIDGIQLEECPLCTISTSIKDSLFYNNVSCDNCPHKIFNKMTCSPWLEKNSTFSRYNYIFQSAHNKTIKKKCIARLTNWENKIKKELKQTK